MIAATRRDVGKTSTCLGVMEALKQALGSPAGYIKPVGQSWKLDEFGNKVDKDAPVFKDHFGLKDKLTTMSPVIIKSGFTKLFLDGEVDMEDERARMQACYNELCSRYDQVVVEGTGHTGVGTIIGLNNAQVAATLGIEMILVANGGLGSTIDELELNRQVCEAHGVRVKGVIVNKVQEEKLEEVKYYLGKALSRWGIPLLGCIPFAKYLDSPTMNDLEGLFGTETISGEGNKLHHFDKFELVTAGLTHFAKKLQKHERQSRQQQLMGESAGSHLDPVMDVANCLSQRTLYVTHGSRSDCILGYLSHANKVMALSDNVFKGGMILTGSDPSQSGIESEQLSWLKEQISHSPVPILPVPLSTHETMQRLTSFTAKLNKTDRKRTDAVATHYAKYIDAASILNGHSSSTPSTYAAKAAAAAGTTTATATAATSAEYSPSNGAEMQLNLT